MALSPSFFDRPADAWVETLAALGSLEAARRAVRAAYRGDDPALPGVPRAIVEALRAAAPALPALATSSAAADGTEKLLVALGDGRAVESVLIPGVRTAASRARMRTRLSPSGSGCARSPGRCGTSLREVPWGGVPGSGGGATSAASPSGAGFARSAKLRGPPRPGRPPRAAGCVSTQVGCGVGCAFCASGLRGLVRNLTAGEVVAQALLLRARARARGLALGSLVLMGMGEPFHNADAVLLALRSLTSPWGGELGAGQVTVSTVGVVAGIERLARDGPAVNLALSLHAPDDATRARIVPLAPRLPPVRDLVAAAGAYARATRRLVTVSYVLLAGVNDAPEQADALVALLLGSGVQHVNLIPWNDVPGLAFAPSPPERANAFFARVRPHLPVHLRRARGAEAAAACGQLRRRETTA